MSLQLVPYLVMDGNSKEAIEFYEKVFAAENLGIVKFGDMPQNQDFPIPEETKDLIAHATLKVGESILMFSDNFPGQPHQKGNQVTICVSTKDADKSRQLFEALQVGGQVSMPLQKTDFSPSYGIVTDKFGVTFQIYTESH